jgi:hypothetical protein
MSEYDFKPGDTLELIHENHVVVIQVMRRWHAIPLYIGPLSNYWRYGEVSRFEPSGFQPLTDETRRKIGWLPEIKETARYKKGDWYFVLGEEDLPKDKDRKVVRIAQSEIDNGHIIMGDQGGHAVQIGKYVTTADAMWRYATEEEIASGS